MLRRLAIMLLALPILAGCRQNPYMDAYIELMNAERRGLEDRIVDLEYDLQKAQRELKGLRGEDSEEGTRRPARAESRDEPNDFDPESLEPPSIIIPDIDGDSGGTGEDSPLLEPPRVDEPNPLSSRGGNAAPSDDDALELPPLSLRSGLDDGDLVDPRGDRQVGRHRQVNGPNASRSDTPRSVLTGQRGAVAPSQASARWTPRSTTDASAAKKVAKPSTRTTESSVSKNDEADREATKATTAASDKATDEPVSTAKSPDKPEWKPFR